MSGLRKYLIIGSILLFGYLVAQYFKPQPTNWNPTYLAKDKIPFGTYILRQQIQDIFPKTVIKTSNDAIYNTLKEKPKGSSNVLIIGSSITVEAVDYAEMVKYMQAGNHIFIAAFQLKGMLADTLKLEINSDFNFQNEKRYPINFVNQKLKRELDYYFDKGTSNQYFSEIDTLRAVVLGNQQKDRANFVKYNFGKGALFIMPNPQLLTNYSLLKEDGLDYAAKTLSYLPNAKTLIWNEYFTSPALNDQSVFRVLFKYDQLRWAYYIALSSLVVFVLFEIKRRQRVIPVIDRLKNTSVEFVSVIGKVYYQQRNNRDIAEKKVVYLLDYIRNRYRLKTLNLDQEFIESLTKITNANADTIEVLFHEIDLLKNGQIVKDDQLISLNKLIEKFYREDK